MSVLKPKIKYYKLRSQLEITLKISKLSDARKNVND